MGEKSIIIIGPAYPYRGGQALVEAYLSKTLTDKDYNVQTISYKLLYPKIFFPGKTQYDQSKVVPFEHNDKIYRILNSINPITWFKAYNKIKTIKPDVVIIVWWMFFFAPCLWTIAHLVKHFTKTKVCFLVENYISHENHWWEKFLVRKTLQQTHCFISESHYITTQIQKDFPQKKVYQTTLSVYDCYDLHRYDKQSAKKFLNIHSDNVLLFFGLIRPYKGLDKLLEVMPDVLKDYPNTKLLVCGEAYEDMNKYLTLIDDLNLKDNVILYNYFIANEDVEPYFKATDMVVMPYNSGTQSGILMMAYGFRVPVVVTNVGGITELIKVPQTGIICKDNSKENLLPAIETLLNNKDKIDYNKNISSFINNLGYGNVEKIVEDIVSNDNK